MANKFKVAPYGFDCVEHNHAQTFIIFLSCKVQSQNSATHLLKYRDLLKIKYIVEYLCCHGNKVILKMVFLYIF